MSAEDYTRGTSMRHPREEKPRLQGAHHFKIDCGHPEQHATSVETRQDMPRHGVPHPVALRGRGTRVRHVGALTERRETTGVGATPKTAEPRLRANGSRGASPVGNEGATLASRRSVNAPSLASLYCVGMLLTISAAQGAWGLVCFILAYALWVVRRTRQAVRREA